MDTLVSETVAALHTLPEEARQKIAVNLLNSCALPVIEFSDPTLDRADTTSDTVRA